MTALAFVLVARNVEDLAEHLGAESLLTSAYNWIVSEHWIAPISWLGGVFVSIGHALASDLFLGIVLASVFFAFLDYRHKIIEWWTDKKNPTAPEKRLALHAKKLFSIWSDFDESTIKYHIKEMKKCREYFFDEPNLIYALDSIIMTTEHDILHSGHKTHLLSGQLWLFVDTFVKILKHPKETRDRRMADLLILEKESFTTPVFAERMVNAPVSQYEDEIRQSHAGIEAETQPKTRH